MSAVGDAALDKSDASLQVKINNHVGEKYHTKSLISARTKMDASVNQSLLKFEDPSIFKVGDTILVNDDIYEVIYIWTQVIGLNKSFEAPVEMGRRWRRNFPAGRDAPYSCSRTSPG